MSNIAMQNQPSMIDGFFTNPLLKKLSKVDERTEECATYKGIVIKCFYFIAVIFAGFIAQAFLNIFYPLVGIPGTTEVDVPTEVAIPFFVALAFFVIVPFVAFLVRRAIPVLGTLYCLGTGYILGFIASAIVDYRTILLIAVVITMAIVAAMCVLYASGIVKVTKKFRTVALTLLLASVLMSGIVCVCAFIPGLREVAAFFQNNMILGILGSVAGIIIASLFLLADFNTVQYIVEKGLPKKYEWISAFGLVFTIVWIYFKVLDLLARAKNNNNK